MPAESSAISERLRRFIAAQITSIDQVELLLLLRQEAQTAWTADAVSQVLRIEPSWAARRLEDLRERRMLVVDTSNPPAYRFQPLDRELDSDIAELARAYAERRVRIIELIYAAPSTAIRTFAAAFRFRRDDTDDADAVYVLCTVTSLLCALLLFRGYRRSGIRLLLWSALCFAGLALNNAFVFVDLVVLPEVDLSLPRDTIGLVAMTARLRTRVGNRVTLPSGTASW
ncbi:MAG TPA: DUF5985 family protein [Candidatus Binatia bacterium]|jgi:hypothetical protein